MTLRPPQAAAGATVLAVAGVLSVYTSVLVLWAMWMNDPLKSIGGLVPILSLILILRAWRSLEWAMDGTWWGLAILVGIIALVHVRDHAILELILSPSWSIFVPPHSLVAVLYTAGAVLLFGGWRLLRATRFPVLLMWLVNPVPNFFTIHIDLPLQHVSSAIARGFAHAMGQKLTPDQLKLMFTPEFGMFIAPGCNGIRGAVTMGFIALIAGYVYKFKPRVTVLLVAGAVLLGYVFNLVRLCFLVLFYITAVHIPWLQSRAEMGDYVIGAVLFFFATGVLFTLIQRLSPDGSLRPPRLERVAAERPVAGSFAGGSFVLRWAAFAVVIVLGSAGYVRALTGTHEKETAVMRGLSDQPPFPERMGGYRLQRVWVERLPTGLLVFYWADYAPDVVLGPGLGPAGHTPNGGEARDGDSGVVSVGISPIIGAHDTLLCHAARGEEWLWHGDVTLPTVGGPTSFSGSFFNDGATQYLEATTVCTGERCGQFTTTGRHLGFVYSRPDTQSVLGQNPLRPIPVLLRTETRNTSMAADAARRELTENLQNFLSGVSLSEFTKPYREP